MNLLPVLFLFVSSLFTADPASDQAKQLAEAKAEIVQAHQTEVELRKTIADNQAQIGRLIILLNGYIGPVAQPPAPKPDPKPLEPKP